MNKRVLNILCFTVLCVTVLFMFCGCNEKAADANKPTPKVNDAYIENVAGKTFEPKSIPGGTFLTFYKDGVATYDYFEHHYGYCVEVVETTDAYIKMYLKAVTIQSDDYIEREYTEATYYYADNSLYYFQPYACMYDPNNSEFYSNTYGEFSTVCAENGCKLYIAASGHTQYCPEHAGKCEHCHDYIDPGFVYCETCPYCYDCGAKIPAGSGYTCDNCKKSPSPNGNGRKCIVCNGTGYVKCYYGSSDLEAYLSGHDPYWYIKCTSCKGTGKD